MPRIVTAGLDGSPESLAAAGWAAREPLLRAATLRVVHAGEHGLDLHEPDDSVLGFAFDAAAQALEVRHLTQSIRARTSLRARPAECSGRP